MKKLLTSVVSLAIAVVIAIGAFAVAKDRGWLSPIGIEPESSDSQIIQAVNRTQEISLVSLGIQGIKTKRQSGNILGIDVPGTSRALFLQYNFDAKLGVDGSKVKITKSGANAYLISVPEFTFIGYANPKFQVAAEDDGVLSWTTPAIDQTKTINEILNDRTEAAYVKKYDKLLRDQTKVFYDTLIHSIDPAITTTFEFAS